MSTTYIHHVAEGAGAEGGDGAGGPADLRFARDGLRFVLRSGELPEMDAAAGGRHREPPRVRNEGGGGSSRLLRRGGGGTDAVDDRIRRSTGRPTCPTDRPRRARGSQV